MKKRVLFICTKNACRSQMAEALVNHDMGDRFEAVSGGVHPTAPHPFALKALADVGIDHSHAKSNHIDEFNDEHFDFVITLCDNADKECPMFFGGTKRVHIGFENPDANPGTEEERMPVFHRVRDDIRDRIEKYLEENE